MFRDQFLEPKYDDAPHLSDQLLLPNLALGHSVYLLSAFAPSYLFRLVEDLAKSPEVEPGFLNIVFFVPGDLALKSSGIARFRNYLLSYAQSEEQVANFVNGALQLIEEGNTHGIGGVNISILHTAQKTPLAKGCMGVITSSEDQRDYVTFVDAKGGDYNSPVRPKKSWLNEDFFEAEGVLAKVVEASGGNHPRGMFVSGAEAIDWLTHLANYYMANQPAPTAAEPEDLLNVDDIVAEAVKQVDWEMAQSDVRDNKLSTNTSISDSDEDETEGDEEDDFLDYLLELDEFQDEENYGWFDGSDTFEDFIPAGDFGVVVEAKDAIDGHIPPLPASIADLVGPARAKCPCGEVIIRAYGCPEVDWE
jgi:hypothetical protein